MGYSSFGPGDIIVSPETGGRMWMFFFPIVLIDSFVVGDDDDDNDDFSDRAK